MSRLSAFWTTIKKNWVSILFALLIYVSIYSSADCLLMGATGSSAISIVRVAIVGGTAIMLFVLGIWKRRQETLLRLPKTSAFFLLFLVLLFFSWLCNIDPLYYENASTIMSSLEYKYLLDITNLLLGFVLATVIDFRFYLRHLSYFLVVSCALGFVLYGIKIVVPGLLTRLPSFLNSAGYQIYTLGLAFAYGNGNRMPGFAREPGVLAIYLILALGFELFGNNRKARWRYVRSAIFVLSLILGQSTGGYIAFVTLFIAFLCKSSVSNKARIIISIVVLVGIGIASPWVIVPTFGKIGSTSFGSRFFSFPACFEMILRNPVFGLSWGKSNEFFQLYSSEWQSVDMHITNTPLHYAAVHGIFFAALVCLGVYAFIKRMIQERPESNRFVLIFLGITFLLAFMNESLTNSVLPFAIAFFGFYALRMPSKITSSKPVALYKKSADKVIHANYKRIIPIGLSIIGSIVSFALTFYLSQNLGGEAYGRISYYIGLLSIFSLVVQAGLPNFVIKNAQFASDPKTFFGKCMLLSSIVFLCGFPIFFAICFFTLETKLDALTVALMGFAAFFDAALIIVCHFLMGIGKKSLSNIMHTLVPKVFMLAVAIIFTVVGKLQNWYGEFYLEILIVGYLISLIPLLAVFLRFSKIRFTKAELISIGLFLLIAVTSSVSSQLAKVFQREFMNKSMISVGALGVCTQIVSILAVLSTAITNVYRPDMAKHYAEGRKDEAFRVYRKITLLMACFTVPFGVGIMVQSEFIISLFSKDYTPYSWIMFFVCGSGTLNAMLGPINALLVSTGYEKYSLVNAIADLAVFVILSLSLGPFYEWGIVFALAGGIVVENLLKIFECFFVYRRSPFSPSALLIIALASGISIGSFYAVSLFQQSILKIAFDLIVGICIIALFTLATVFINRRNRRRLSS